MLLVKLLIEQMQDVIDLMRIQLEMIENIDDLFLGFQKVERYVVVEDF